MRNRFIVCYDITDQKRLAKIYKKMRGFGDPVQYSVFRCDLSPTEKVIMVSQLSEMINHKNDRIMIVDIGPNQGRGGESIDFIGKSVEFSSPKAIIV